MNKELIILALSPLKFSNGTSIVECISSFVIKEENIGFSIEAQIGNIEEANSLRETALKILRAITSKRVTIVITSDFDKNKPLNKEAYIGFDANSKAAKEKVRIANVRQIICVSSGKGGVGKSTISAALAQTLCANGYKVGIVDADIYGPSIPKIFDIEGSKPIVNEGFFIPIESDGIKIMSIGLMIEPGVSLPWRGPMVSKAIHQLLRGALWGELDFLIIDMPPGTGDIHLSLLSSYNINGVIIVTTPQSLATADAARAIDMYNKFHTPLLGIIENMSYLILPDTGKHLEIFGGNGGEELATKYHSKLLVKVPLDPKIALACEAGEDLTLKLDLQKVINPLIKQL